MSDNPKRAGSTESQRLRDPTRAAEMMAWELPLKTSTTFKVLHEGTLPLGATSQYLLPPLEFLLLLIHSLFFHL